MTLDKLIVEQSLKKKGFRIVAGDHERFIYFTIDGRQTDVKTKFSRSSRKDVEDGIEIMMSKQCHLSKSKFRDLIKCPLTQDMYEAILRKQGFCD